MKKYKLTIIGEKKIIEVEDNDLQFLTNTFNDNIEQHPTIRMYITEREETIAGITTHKIIANYLA